jgi:WD40 repeat protein
LSDVAPNRPAYPPSPDPGEAPAQQLTRLWRQGHRPDVGEFLGRFRPLDPALAVEVLAADQRERWQSGEKVPAEAYRERFPELLAKDDDLLDLVYHEVLLREELGDLPGAEEYERRFPHLAAPLRMQLAFHRAVDDPSKGARTFVAPAGTFARVPRGGPRIAGHEIVAELGRGGMGVVYQAWQTGLNRLVAVKMVLAGRGADAGDLIRFRAEAEAIGRMDHPGIVNIYSLGEQDGCPYYTMEFVDGGSLAQKLDGTPRAPRTAAELMERVALAAHAAHQRGIIHRDLKPGNILLACSAQGVRLDAGATSYLPKIGDFGLAKIFTGGSESPTVTGSILGTPSYMAPEQARGSGPAVSPATDVYALGAVLYELLTGHPPFKACTPAETLLQVLESDPVPPRRLQPAVPRDLEIVCLQCLAKDPRKRYGGADELAADLRRFLLGQPVRARPVGVVERTLKWAKRRPAVATLLLLMIATAGLGFALVTWQWREALAAQAQAEHAREREADHRRAYQRLALGMLVDQGIDLCERGEIPRGLLQLGYCLERHAGADPDLERVIRFNLADWSKRLCPLRLCVAHPARVLAVALHPDGNRIAAGGEDGKVFFWDARTGQAVGAPLVLPDCVNALAFSPDGEHLLAGTGDTDGTRGTVSLWPVRSAERSGRRWDQPGPVWAVAFSADGKRFLTGGGTPGGPRGALQLWDATRGKPLGEPWPHPRPVRAVALSPDGRFAASGCEDRKARVWEVASGDLVRTWTHGGYVEAVAFAPDGTTLAAGSRDSLVRVWDVETDQPRGKPLSHQGYVTSLAFRPDGGALLSGSLDARARLWDLRTGKPIHHPLTHQNQVTAVAFGADGKVLTGSLDRTVRLWDLPPAPPHVVLPHKSQVSAAAFHPRDGLILTASGGLVQLWDAGPGHAVGKPLRLPGTSRALAFHPDGTLALTGSNDKTARLLDLVKGEPSGEPLTHPRAVLAVAFGPGGRALATACADGKVRRWDVETRQPLGLPLGPCGAVRALAFHPQGGPLLLTGGDDKVARLWDVETGQCVRELIGGPRSIISVAWSADGRRVATGSDDGVARIYDAHTGKPIGQPLRCGGAVTSVAFNPGGDILLTASRDGKARFWDAATGKPLGMPLEHTGPVRSVLFSADGQRALTASEDMTACLWPLPQAGTDPARDLVLGLEVGTGMRFEEGGGTHVLDAPSWSTLRNQLPLPQAD